MIFSAGVYAGQTNTWADGTLAQYDGEKSDSTNVFLDVPNPLVALPGTVVLRAGATWAAYDVKAVTDVSLSAFSLNGRSTRVTLDSRDKLDKFGIRSTIVYAASRWLPLAQVPEDEPIGPGTGIELDGWVEGLEGGRSVTVSGMSATTLGLARSDVRKLLAVEHRLNRPGGDATAAPWGTKITLDQPLSDSYLRVDANLAPSFFINANTAAATHGETRHEVLGSGDRSVPFQSFTLRQPPLTYVSSKSADGIEFDSQPVHQRRPMAGNPQLLRKLAAGPGVHLPAGRRRDTDGRIRRRPTGVRLPTGPENVEAHYRKGAGVGGLVRAGQLTMLINRPPGVQQVTNPVPGTGGDDPETLQAARTNAPLAVRTLGRVVSLQDYEDFARAFAGIAKALAVWSRAGGSRGVFVTVAGPLGAAVGEGDPVHDNLVVAIRALGDPHVPFRVASYSGAASASRRTSRSTPLTARTTSRPRSESVLRSTFGFDARNLGQPVALSELIATIQAVAGVVA